MEFTIDRFEGEFAVVELEDGKIAQISRIAIPTEAKEGDIISIKIEIDKTKNRKESIKRKMSKLFKD